MNPINFNEVNVNYVADGCEDLPVFKGDNQIISCWELSAEEIQEIVKNKVIWLSIWGNAQPPVCLMAETPFIESQKELRSPCEECDPVNNPACTKECQEVCPECENHKKQTKVFLGGTCNGSTWRDYLINRLKIDYFNPVVPDWTPECMEEELRQRGICDYCLYVITTYYMSSVYSIAEVVDDSNKQPEKTIFCVSEHNGTFLEGQRRSLNQVGKMVERNGGKYFTDLNDVAKYLNGKQVL